LHLWLLFILLEPDFMHPYFFREFFSLSLVLTRPQFSGLLEWFHTNLFNVECETSYLKTYKSLLTFHFWWTPSTSLEEFVYLTFLSQSVKNNTFTHKYVQLRVFKNWYTCTVFCVMWLRSEVPPKPRLGWQGSVELYFSVVILRGTDIVRRLLTDLLMPGTGNVNLCHSKLWVKWNLVLQ